MPSGADRRDRARSRFRIASRPISLLRARIRRPRRSPSTARRASGSTSSPPSITVRISPRAASFMMGSLQGGLTFPERPWRRSTRSRMRFGGLKSPNLHHGTAQRDPAARRDAGSTAPAAPRECSPASRGRWGIRGGPPSRGCARRPQPQARHSRRPEDARVCREEQFDVGRARRSRRPQTTPPIRGISRPTILPCAARSSVRLRRGESAMHGNLIDGEWGSPAKPRRTSTRPIDRAKSSATTRRRPRKGDRRPRAIAAAKAAFPAWSRSGLLERHAILSICNVFLF